MKKNSDGTHRARLNARGFYREVGVHYITYDVLVPVFNDITIRVVLILIIMAAWWAELM